ncbi:MAG: transglycosylase domain-containing protein [Candidatus Pacebacteria bacterium]|nr:transglycosylase domain-containing protein [Candidatus Paceibacterota bacterium]
MQVGELLPRLRPFGPRAALLKLHSDLFIVHSRVQPYAQYYPPEMTNLEKLVVALEDRRFLNHAGVDLISVVREVGRAVSFKRHGGASTIDMQFVRTATGYRKPTAWRKFYEMLLAYFIQYRYSKITILRSYLDCAFFGSHLIGARRAAQSMFSADYRELTIEQAAMLAAMLVYPRPLEGGETWLAKVRRRSDYGMRVYIANKKRFDQLPR